MAEQTLNVPQLIVFLVVTLLALRWYLSKPAATAARPTANRATPRVSSAQIDQIAQMFPQLDRRSIAWDLSRNGGNVTATTEKVLSGRALDAPPVSFQIPASRTTTPARVATPPVKAAQPDLITRYGLASKLNAGEAAPAEGPRAKMWSQDRNERQSNLQKRREEMILAARRKLEEKERAKASGKAA